MIRVKRIYEKKEADDGFRILADRLWPRGIKRDENIDLWLSEVAPSNELRKWFDHDPKKWDSLLEQYREELNSKPDLKNQILELEKEHGTITLLFSAKDTIHNNACALKLILQTTA